MRLLTELPIRALRRLLGPPRAGWSPRPTTLWQMIAVSALITACASTPPPISDDLPTPPANLSGWSVSGKASATTAQGSETVNIRWQRTDSQRERLILSGPLGLGALELNRVGTTVVWLDNGELRPIDTLPLDDASRHMAASLPIRQLGNWLLGHPPTSPDWAVTVTEWQDAGGWKLPRKLELSHEQQRFRLVLLDWRLEGSP